MFLTAAAFGMCDSIWQTALSSVYGTLFPANKEAAFSNRNFWRSLGSVIGRVGTKKMTNMDFHEILPLTKILNCSNQLKPNF